MKGRTILFLFFIFLRLDYEFMTSWLYEGQFKHM